MEEDFLVDNNPCGQALLQLVSRGNAIIAELLRLKDHIPPIFRLESTDDVQRYGEIILGYNYFNSPEVFDRKIESSETLREISEEIRECHGEILVRFYKAYESVYQYVTDLNSFVDELEDGTYIQQSMDTVFMCQDGLQLMCESMYLYGVMLLVLELYHPGVLRERILVAYSRYNITVESLDRVCALVRSTGFMNTANARRPPNYPVDYFKRFPVNNNLVKSVITKLRTEDIYSQQKTLHFDKNKTTALTQQSALLFVCLFFAPDVLTNQNQAGRMREIVDKYFSDNWVINIYMGITANLVDMWEPFKVAKTALGNTLHSTNVKEIASAHFNDLERLLSETNFMLAEGFLNKTYVMDNVVKVLSLAHDSNVTLRWLLLHTTTGKHGFLETVKRAKQVRELVMADSNDITSRILELLLNSAQFEIKVCDMFKTALDEREEQWSSAKSECLIRITELSDVFSGVKNVMRVRKNESLRKWFDDIGKEIDSLNLEESAISIRKIRQLIEALEHVQSFQQMTNNLGVKQLASEACLLLKEMLIAASAKNTFLVQMQIIGDFSYGWLIVDNYTDLIQNKIKNDPGVINKLRAVFLKLGTAMETALLRINQANDGNLPSVSQHYSHQLVRYVCRVLQVIPREVFKLMSEVTLIQTSRIPELPARIERDKIKDYAQLESRFEIAKLTHQMSVFCTGLLNMQSTLVGIIRVDPRELLEDGVRKELRAHITSAFEQRRSYFLANSKIDANDLGDMLHQLGNAVEGQKNSFEFVQDYIGLNGSKMWHDELKSAVGRSVDIECRMLKQKGTASQVCPTFIGCLANALIEVTDPKTTVFSEQESAWGDKKTKTKLVDLKYFAEIMRALSVPGMVGLNKIFGFMIVRHLQKLMAYLSKEANNNKLWLQIFGEVSKSLTPRSLTIEQPATVYGPVVTRLSRLFASSGIGDTLISIGHLQLLRKQISFTLNSTAKVHSRSYTSALLALNEAYLTEVKSKKSMPNSKDLETVSQLLEWIGLNDPMAQIYVTTKGVPYIALFLFLYTSSYLSNFSYEKTLGTQICKKTGEGIACFTAGLATFLKQFHPCVTDQFVAYASQYVKSHMLSFAMNSKNQQQIEDKATTMLEFLQNLVYVMDVPREVIIGHIPSLILDLFDKGVAAYVESK